LPFFYFILMSQKIHAPFSHLIIVCGDGMAAAAVAAVAAVALFGCGNIFFRAMNGQEMTARQSSKRIESALARAPQVG
jgi:hypothetical protein